MIRILKIPDIPPNITFRWLSLVFRIAELLASNLDPKTGYPD
jgi:hypothetical protein